MQYIRLALSLAWPQMAVALLWLGVALVALWYARATRRPIFLFGGITALMISLSEVLSPIRLAYRYFTHREDCVSTAACTVELQFGAAKFEWLLVALAAFVLFAGIWLEIRRARRRAAANNAARAVAQRAAAAAAAGGVVSGGIFAGHYQAPPEEPEPSSAGYEVALPGMYSAAPPEDMAGPASPDDLPAPAEDERPIFYRRPGAGSGSGPF